MSEAGKGEIEVTEFLWPAYLFISCLKIWMFLNLWFVFL
jgi:hypothetical protein